MSRLEWDRMLETGDQAVDDAHRAMFEMFNDLRDIAVDDRADDVGELLSQLMRYTSVHFAQEQELMIRTGFPPEDVMPHVEAHDALAQHTREMAERHARGELTTVLPLAAFLHAWLREHIRMQDRRLVAHVRERHDAAERRGLTA